MSKNLDKKYKEMFRYYRQLGEISKKARILELLAKIKGILESEDDVYVFNDKGLSKKRGKRSYN